MILTCNARPLHWLVRQVLLTFDFLGRGRSDLNLITAPTAPEPLQQANRQPPRITDKSILSSEEVWIIEAEVEYGNYSSNFYQH